MKIHNSIQKIISKREARKKRRIKYTIILFFVFFIGIFIGNIFVQNDFSITGLVASGVLPTVGGDAGNWGTVLNNYLLQEHTSTGGHKNVNVEGDLNASGSIRASDAFLFSDGSTQATAATPSGFSWHVTSASFNQNFSVATEDTSPQDVFFKPDGTKMYVTGNTNDEVNEYNLSTSWDVSTAVFNQNFSVATEDTEITGIFFKPDGTKMYILGFTGIDVNEYNLSMPWDVSTASFNQLLSIAEDTSPIGIFFKPDGTKMYILGFSDDEVNEYNLSTSWDVSTAVFNQNFSVATEDTIPAGIFFKPDGTKMYIVGFTDDDINEYHLSMPWDVSTASFNQLFSIATEDTSPQGIFFKPDGAKMYVVGVLGVDVNEYDLGLVIEGNVRISGNISGTPNANTLYAKSLPKAWVSFDGTSCVGGGPSGSCSAESCTIKDSFNVDCVNRTSNGNYTLYWDRDFANANYIATGNPGKDVSVAGSTINLQQAATGSIKLRIRNGAGADEDHNQISIIAFGEQS